jgi:hypothetical protein
MSAFRRDLTADLKMLQDQQDARRAQLGNARTVLEMAKSQVEQLLQQIPAK